MSDMSDNYTRALNADTTRGTETMSDVDAILASGVYVDRRGSRWERTDQGEYTQWWSEDEWPCIEHADMRRLIERDLHRETCPGLGPHPCICGNDCEPDHE